MRPKLRNQLRIIAAILLSTYLYDEYVIYYIKSLKWPEIRCSAREEDCLKILLVADPQILGRNDETGILGYIFDWDSNRYLTKTYRRAWKHFEPDAVFFLGDLTYEGRISTRKEFQRNVDELSSIFSTPYPVAGLWLAGDNDVGGEDEPIYPSRVKQFNDAFRQKDYAEIKNVIVYKANGLFQIMPRLAPSHDKNYTKVVLSHMPLLLSPGRYTETVFAKLQPSVIFSGHKHSAYHLETTSDATFVSKVAAMTPQDRDAVVKVEFKFDNYHEFIVPTCSYRMGVPNVGYGIAIIEKSKYLTYTILWSPKRFEQLFIYLMLFTILCIYILLLLMCKIISALCQSTIQYFRV